MLHQQLLLTSAGELASKKNIGGPPRNYPIDFSWENYPIDFFLAYINEIPEDITPQRKIIPLKVLFGEPCSIYLGILLVWARNREACKLATLTFAKDVFPIVTHERWVVDLDAATHDEQTIANTAVASSSFARKRTMTISLKEGPLRKQSIVLGFNIPQGNQPHPNHYKPLGLFKVPRKILEKISGKTLKSMNHLFIYLNTIYGKKRKSTVSCGIHWALPPQPLIVGNVECASPFAVSSSTTSDAANPSKTLNDLVWLRIQMGTGEPRT